MNEQNLEQLIFEQLQKTAKECKNSNGEETLFETELPATIGVKYFKNKYGDRSVVTVLGHDFYVDVREVAQFRRPIYKVVTGTYTNKDTNEVVKYTKSVLC